MAIALPLGYALLAQENGLCDRVFPNISPIPQTLTKPFIMKKTYKVNIKSFF